MSDVSTQRKPLDDISKPSLVSSLERLSIFRDTILQGLKDLWHWRNFWRKMAGYSCTITAAEVIRIFFWTQSDLWWLALCASLSVLTLSAWSSATVERMIGKPASTRIDLERNLSAGATRTILTINKNRYASRTGYAGTIEFDPLTYTFKEIPKTQLDTEFNIEFSKLVKGLVVNGDKSSTSQMAI